MEYLLNECVVRRLSQLSGQVNESDMPYNTNMINEVLNDDLDDAYVHCVVHTYIKFIFSGTDIRTLIDLYVYNEHLKDQLDGNYVQE